MTATGPMREVVHLQAQSTAQDAAGQRVVVWGTVASRRAQVTQEPGAEPVASPGRVARVPTTFRIRYPRTLDVTPAMRLVHRNRVFNVVSAADPDGRRVDMLLTCEELVGETP